MHALTQRRFEEVLRRGIEMAQPPGHIFGMSREENSWFLRFGKRGERRRALSSLRTLRTHTNACAMDFEGNGGVEWLVFTKETVVQRFAALFRAWCEAKNIRSCVHTDTL